MICKITNYNCKRHLFIRQKREFLLINVDVIDAVKILRCKCKTLINFCSFLKIEHLYNMAFL